MSKMIVHVTTARQIEAIRELFTEYQAWLGIDLCFQNFAQEIKTLPGKYAAPRGRLLLATVDEAFAGCVALRPLEQNVCEMKRLYVRPTFRGKDLGRALVERVISEAREIGYAWMRLDTLSAQMPEAVNLYRRFGFRETAAYNDNPIEGTMFMELAL